MARNKSQSQEGLNDSRQDNLDDNKKNQNRESDDTQRGNSRKGNKAGRKGSPGKNNNQ